MTLTKRGRTPGPVGTFRDLEDDIAFSNPEARPRLPGPSGIAPRGVLFSGPLANAGGGSGSTQLSQPAVPRVKLVEPEPTDGTYVLRPEFTPRFNGNPKPGDVIQGELAACPLAAVLVAAAHANPQLLTNMFTETTAIVVSTLASDSTFREVTSVVITVQFRNAKPIEISRLLYYESLGDEDQAVFQIPYAHSDTGVSWVSFIEKAYAVLRGKNSYATLNIDRQLDAIQVMTDVVGPPLHLNLLHGRLLTPKGKDMKNEDLSDRHLIAVLQAAKQRPTIAASLDQVSDKRISKNHGYGVLGFDGKRVSLRNPHGGTGAEVLLSLADFKKNFEAVLQATS